MDPKRIETLRGAGVDVDGALERLMGSAALLERLLGKFASDGSYAALRRALENRDADGAVAAAHTLKGMCGNLSMTELFSLFGRQVELLRAGDLEGAEALMESIVPAYEQMIRAIEEV